MAELEVMLLNTVDSHLGFAAHVLMVTGLIIPTPTPDQFLPRADRE